MEADTGCARLVSQRRTGDDQGVAVLEPGRSGEWLAVAQKGRGAGGGLHEDVSVGSPDDGEYGIGPRVGKTDIRLGTTADPERKVPVRAGAPAAYVLNDDVASQIFSWQRTITWAGSSPATSVNSTRTSR